MIKPHFASLRSGWRNRPVLLLCMFLLACSDSIAGRGLTEAVAVVGGESPAISLVEPSSGAISRIGPLQSFKDAGALSRSGERLLLTDVGKQGRDLISVSLRDLKVVQRLELNSPVAAHSIDGIYVGGTALAISDYREEIAAGNAYLTDSAPPSDGEYVAVLDSAALHVIGVVGPLQVRETFGLATLSPGAAAPSGAILAIGSRLRRASGAGNTVDRLWVIDPVTLTIVDSLQPEPDPPVGKDALLRQVVASPDGRHAYVVSSAGVIYECDLAEHQVVASAPAYGTGQLAVSPDGRALYLTDEGDYYDTPGSGEVFVYGPDLQPRPPIDLRPAFSGRVPVTSGVAVSASDSMLYVATGTGHLGPTYGAQPLQLLVVDLTGRAPLRKIPLSDWGTAMLFTVKR